MIEYIASNDIRRFIKPIKENYITIVTELKAEKKVNHWIWFVFPQLRELGYSLNAKYYGLSGTEEAREFYKNRFLRKKLLHFVSLLIKAKQTDPVKILGETDSKKLCSSMTLFYEATHDVFFKSVIDKFFGGKMDENTLILLK